MDLSQTLLENSGFRHSFNAFHMRSPDKITNLPEAFLLFEQREGVRWLFQIKKKMIISLVKYL